MTRRGKEAELTPQSRKYLLELNRENRLKALPVSIRLAFRCLVDVAREMKQPSQRNRFRAEKT